MSAPHVGFGQSNRSNGAGRAQPGAAPWPKWHSMVPGNGQRLADFSQRRGL